MSSPYVTVVMPVYNAEQYLSQAVESILGQTYRDFEFVIIDDSSTDDTPEQLASYAARDARIALIRNDRNLGQSRSVNEAIRLAQGKYIVRMDADDISLQERVSKQTAFMDAHPQVGICGTWLRFIGKTKGVWRYPQEDAAIKCQLLFNSPIGNPTSILRRSVIVEHQLAFQSEAEPAEDYTFWSKAAAFTKFANLPEVLLHYRTHANQQTSARRSTMFAAADKVRIAQLARLGIAASDDITQLHLKVLRPREPLTREFVERADSWIQMLQAANRQTRAFPELEFTERLDRQWLVVCRSAADLGMFAWQSYWRSPLSRRYNVDPATRLRFFTACALPRLRRLRRSLQ